ncbi:MAG: hypothetical protein ABSA15_04130, partial [Thermoplasmata archaeon]
TFRAPDRANVTGGLASGKFSVLLPGSTTYGVSFQDTLLGPGPNGSYYTTYTAVGGACAVPAGSNGDCTVSTSAYVDPVWFNGTLTNAAGSLPISGTLRITGPSGSSAVTVVSTTSGAFSIALAPGTYTLYATGGGPSDPLAAIGQVVLLPSVGSYTIPLQATWAYTVTVLTPSSGGIRGGAVVLSVGPVGTGATAVFTGLTLGVPYTISLPVGTYTVRATAVGSPFGPTANASGTQTVSIVRGNLATTLALTYVYIYHVSATLVGPTSSTIPGGATSTFTFRLTSNSTGPETLHFVGSPAFWNFTFSPSTVTLGVGTSSNAATVQVAIRVPAGELVAHPGIALQAVADNGTTMATIAPVPVIHVVPYYGLGLGPVSSSQPPEIAPTRILVPFYLVDNGNINETVTMNVVDGTRLANLGWNYNITQNGAIISGPVQLQAATNTTYLLNLTAKGPVFLLPGSATISAATSITNSSLQRRTQLTIPVVTVSINTTTFTLVGPGVGTAPATLPPWLVPVLLFVPAIVLVAIVLVWRWNRTRRWERR